MPSFRQRAAIRRKAMNSWAIAHRLMDWKGFRVFRGARAMPEIPSPSRRAELARARLSRTRAEKVRIRDLILII